VQVAIRVGSPVETNLAGLRGRDSRLPAGRLEKIIPSAANSGQRKGWS
jgi:hypothetical protein